MIGTWELILIVAILVLLFGAKRIPDIAKGIGKAVREFRKGLESKEEPDATEAKRKNKLSGPADGKKKKKG
jgi:sec-independent protein translocase protein TatA